MKTYGTTLEGFIKACNGSEGVFYVMEFYDNENRFITVLFCFKIIIHYQNNNHQHKYYN